MQEEAVENIKQSIEPANERASLHRQAAILEEAIERWELGIKVSKAELVNMTCECKASKKQLENGELVHTDCDKYQDNGAEFGHD